MTLTYKNRRITRPLRPPDAVFSPYASVRYFTPHMVHSQYNLLWCRIVKPVYTPLSLRDWVMAAPRHPPTPADAPWRACLLPASAYRQAVTVSGSCMCQRFSPSSPKRARRKGPYGRLVGNSYVWYIGNVFCHLRQKPHRHYSTFKLSTSTHLPLSLKPKPSSDLSCIVLINTCDFSKKNAVLEILTNNRGNPKKQKQEN